MLILMLLASLFITLALGFYVLVAAPQRAINRTFAAFVGLMIVWIVNNLAFWCFHPAGADAGWWATVSFLVGAAVQFALLLFAGVFPEDTRPDWRLAAWCALPLLVLLPMLFGGMFWERAGFTITPSGEQFSITLRPAAYIFGAYNYAVLTIGLVKLAGKYRRYRGTLEGQQLGAILLGIVVTGALVTLSHIILPLVGVSVLIPYGPIFTVIGTLIYAYAISNFKLFSLQTALDQFRLFPIAYKVALVVAVTGVFGFFLVQVPVAVWCFGWEVTGWKRYLIFSAISGLLPSLVMILLITRILAGPLRRLTETTLDVARGNYGARTTLESNDELGVLADSINTMSQRIAADIARLREINQALIRTEKLATAGALATGVAHEVNNPLASISSLVQSLMARPREERDQQTLRLILAQITRISGVLRNLMDFARPKSPERAPADINDVITKSLELARFDRQFRQLTVRTEMAGGLPLLALDADQMQQVFLNLLLNARDAVAENQGGEISIATSRHDDEVRISIADNGSGIAPEHLTRIFDPFFSTKPHGQGTGLGLSVCDSIITAHRGRITVESNAAGTVFTIAFPDEGRNRSEAGAEKENFSTISQ
ncbi:MAG TPA: ATP-binding protein [Blastocatellia bacterium]|nr:ATP-binding protein [Blastocatellia bacterium]